MIFSKINKIVKKAVRKKELLTLKVLVVAIK